MTYAAQPMTYAQPAYQYAGGSVEAAPNPDPATYALQSAPSMIAMPQGYALQSAPSMVAMPGSTPYQFYAQPGVGMPQPQMTEPAAMPTTMPAAPTAAPNTAAPPPTTKPVA